ncbi:MAG TPA: LrgB family protein [Bacillota bacterium]|nr:LrgB family protein [Bacillota bacterium]
MQASANFLLIPFGFFLTLLVYSLFNWMHIKLRKVWTNPMVLSMICIPFLLNLGHVSISSYQLGASYISTLIGPATIALAIPMAKQFSVLKKHAGAILFGTCVGSTMAFIMNFLLSYWANLPKSVISAMAPKSVTTPIAIEVAKHLGGDPALTTGMVVSTGIIGMLFAQGVLSFFRIKESIARGVAMGVSFHAIGIVRAREEGEVTGAIGSICIALAGIVTTIIAPLLFPLLSKLF